MRAAVAGGLAEAIVEHPGGDAAEVGGGRAVDGAHGQPQGVGGQLAGGERVVLGDAVAAAGEVGAELARVDPAGAAAVVVAVE